MAFWALISSTIPALAAYVQVRFLTLGIKLHSIQYMILNWIFVFRFEAIRLDKRYVPETYKIKEAMHNISELENHYYK